MTDDQQQAFRLPPTLLGTTYLTEFVIALFPDFPAAQAAGAALEAEGFSQDAMIVGSGEQLLANEQEIRDQRGLKDRILGLFPSPESEIVDVYERRARQGDAVVAVHAPDSDRERHDRAIATLRAAGGRHMHYYGKRVVEDL